jgi:ABC-type Zn uptake system ZnuABC Zn-binding protein ZnuA
LDAEALRIFDGLPDRKVVTFHDAFPYFCRRHGLELVGVIEEVPGAEPSPRYLARLSKAIRAGGARVIFTEPQFNPLLARRLAVDLGVRIAELDVLETGTPSKGFYVEGMRRNFRAVEAALR